jgi:Sel1 repeat/U-box domain
MRMCCGRSDFSCALTWLSLTGSASPQIQPTMTTPTEPQTPYDLICPITLELPWDPVIAEDGRLYDCPAIKAHFEQHPSDLRSPITNEKMGQHLKSAPQIKTLLHLMVEKGVIGGDLASKWNEMVKQQKDTEVLLKRAEEGNAVSMYNLGVFYRDGTKGFKKDEELTVAWFTKAHLAGSVPGTALLGDSICNGHGGVVKCHITGMMYLGIAAGQGSDYAAYQLGKALANGTCGVRVNKGEAIYWLQKAAGTCVHNHMAQSDKEKAQQEVNKLLHHYL